MADSPNIEWIIYGGSTLLNAAVAAWTWFSNRDSADSRDVENLRERITTIEETVRHLPDAETVSQIAGDMRELRATMEAVRQSIVPLTAAVDRINTYLLNNK